jgi:hypothetical protein
MDGNVESMFAALPGLNKDIGMALVRENEVSGLQMGVETSVS